jgi:hypothetical protein
MLTFISVNGQAQLIQNETSINQTQEKSKITPFTIPRSDGTEEDAQGSSTSTSNSVRANEADIIILSQRYNQEQFGDSIVGEVENNGIATADFVQITASFYNVNGQIVGTEFTYADPSSIEPGSRSPFEIFITSEAIQDETERYEFTLQWTNPDGSEDSKRVLGETEGGQPSNEDNDNEENQDNGDDGNNDGNSGSSNSDDSLEELGRMLGID